MTVPAQTLTAKGRQTREAIEQAARKLFAERGFHGTTLADITSAAGKSPAVFYRYFDDKEDLLAALAESFLHDVVDAVGPDRARCPSHPRTASSSPRWSTGYWNMFKQNIGHHDRGRPAGRDPTAVRRRAERVSAVRHGHRRGLGAPRPGAGLRRRPATRSTSRAAIALLFENFTTVFVGVDPGLGLEISDEDAIATLVDDLEEDAVRLLTTTRRSHVDFTLPEHLPGLLAEMDAFIEREIKPLERGEHAVLRPSSRVRPHRLGQRRHPGAGMGGPARRDAQARRQGRLAALRPAVLSSAAATAPTSTWRSSGNTWRTRGSACTTTCRTSRRSSATSRR